MFGDTVTDRSVGVGLIGVGWMGRLHTRSYLAVRAHYPGRPRQPRLAIAADPVETNREFARNSLGYPQVTSDYRMVIENPEVDVISICSPNQLHREIALAAADAGKPFWIEKPMGRTAGESADITRAAANAGLITCVGFNYRHAPMIQHARALIEQGRLGAINRVTVSFLADYSADPRGARTWRFVREQAGSGVLGDLMSHGIDLAGFLVGPISEVSAVTQTVIGDRPVPAVQGAGHFSAGVDGERLPVENEDHVAMIARFAGSSAVGFLEASRIAIGHRADYSLRVAGTLGEVAWNFSRMNELEVCISGSALEHGFTRVEAAPGHGDFEHFQPGSGTAMGFDDLKVIEARLFLDSLATGKQLAPSAADAWAAAEVVAAAERSAGDGRWHTVRPIAS